MEERTDTQTSVKRKGNTVTITTRTTITTISDDGVPRVKTITRVDVYDVTHGFDEIPHDLRKLVEEASKPFFLKISDNHDYVLKSMIEPCTEVKERFVENQTPPAIVPAIPLKKLNEVVFKSSTAVNALSYFNKETGKFPLRKKLAISGCLSQTETTSLSENRSGGPRIFELPFQAQNNCAFGLLYQLLRSPFSKLALRR